MICDAQLSDWEILACSHEKHEHFIMRQLISEVRRLRHELADPNYLYSGRIHRQGIISRNMEIDRLNKEIRELKTANETKPQASEQESP